MANQIQVNSNEINRILQESEILIKENEEKTAHIKGELEKIKKKSKEIDRRISLLL